MSTRSSLHSISLPYGWWFHVWRDQGSGRLGMELVRRVSFPWRVIRLKSGI